MIAAVRPAGLLPATPSPLLGILLPLFGIRLSRRTHKRPSLYLTALLSLGIVLTISGCGGGFFNLAPRTYPITVTATSGSLQHSTTVNLTVE
jgi:hypothetical protein